ncbi:hypothetical protein M9458_044175, partial [Cirrhinus mrigala]
DCFEHKQHRVFPADHGCGHRRAADGKAFVGEGHPHQLAMAEPRYLPHPQTTHQIRRNTV